MATENPGATGSAPTAASTTTSTPEVVEEFDEVELLWSFHTLHQYLFKNLGVLEKSAQVTGDAE